MIEIVSYSDFIHLVSNKYKKFKYLLGIITSKNINDT